MARLYFSPPANEPLRHLLDNGIPVVFNQWYAVETRFRHYRVIHGYDDETSEFIASDPLQGPYYRIANETFAALSDPGNFIPVYLPELDPLVQSLMADLGAKELSCSP